MSLQIHSSAYMKCIGTWKRTYFYMVIKNWNSHHVKSFLVSRQWGGGVPSKAHHVPTPLQGKLLDTFFLPSPPGTCSRRLLQDRAQLPNTDPNLSVRRSRHAPWPRPTATPLAHVPRPRRAHLRRLKYSLATTHAREPPVPLRRSWLAQ